jgi:hypothetical protein
MNAQRTSLSVAITFAGGLLAGCSDMASAGAPAPLPWAEPPPRVQVYNLAGDAGAKSRVERTVRVDGSETLLGETQLAGDGGAVLRERVEIDAAGTLVYADVLLDPGADSGSPARPGDGRARRMILDRQRGAALFLGPGSGTLRVPRDAPWAYAPWPASAAPSATPIAAWVMLRAASGSPAVRLVDGGRATSYGVASDQLVVQDEGDVTVVLGDAAIPAGSDFVVWPPAPPTRAAEACGDARLAGVWRVPCTLPAYSTT